MGQLASRGPHSFRQRGAENLAWAKSQAVSMLEKQNQEWGQAYGQQNTNAYIPLIKGLQTIVGDQKFMQQVSKDPTQAQAWGDVRMYLQARQWVVGQLTARKAAGGSADINAQSNTDLAYAFDAFNTALQQQNSYYQQIFTYYLSNDPLKALP